MINIFKLIIGILGILIIMMKNAIYNTIEKNMIGKI